MLVAWTVLDLSRNTESVQQILHEPLHGNVNISQNTKISRLMGFQINLVQDIWDFKTNNFKPVVGLITNGLFRRHYNQIKDNFPRQWVRILKNEDPYDGELDTIFLLHMTISSLTYKTRQRKICIQRSWASADKNAEGGGGGGGGGEEQFYPEFDVIFSLRLL